MAVNKVILVGNVGKDPEVRYLEGGAAVARFTMATSEVYKNRSGEKVTQTEWHNIVLWRSLAELAEKFIKKGSQLYIEGRIRSRSYEKDGVQRRVTEIQGDVVQLLGRRASDDSAPSASDETEKLAAPDDISVNNLPQEDDLPF